MFGEFKVIILEPIQPDTVNFHVSNYFYDVERENANET